MSHHRARVLATMKPVAFDGVVEARTIAIKRVALEASTETNPIGKLSLAVSDSHAALHERSSFVPHHPQSKGIEDEQQRHRVSAGL